MGCSLLFFFRIIIINYYYYYYYFVIVDALGVTMMILPIILSVERDLLLVMFRTPTPPEDLHPTGCWQSSIGCLNDFTVKQRLQNHYYRITQERRNITRLSKGITYHTQITTQQWKNIVHQKENTTLLKKSFARHKEDIIQHNKVITQIIKDLVMLIHKLQPQIMSL